MTTREQTIRRLRMLTAIPLIVMLALTGVLTVFSVTLRWNGMFTPGGDSSRWDDGFTVLSQQVDATFTPSGDLSVVEDWQIQWDQPRRGIIYDIILDWYGEQTFVTDVNVSSDTYENMEWDTYEQGRMHVIETGDDVTFREGEDHIRMEYTIVGDIFVPHNDADTFRWDVGFDTATLIRELDVTLNFPTTPTSTGCVFGGTGATFACDTAEGDSSITFSQQNVRPDYGLTVEAQFPEGTWQNVQTVQPSNALHTPENQLNRLERPDPIWLYRIAIATLLIGLSALPLLGTFVFGKRREQFQETALIADSTAVQYMPPKGVHPISASYMLFANAHATHYDAVMLLDLAHRGVIEMDEQVNEKTGRVEGLKFRLGNAMFEPHEQGFIHKLCKNGKEWYYIPNKAPTSPAQPEFRHRAGLNTEMVQLQHKYKQTDFRIAAPVLYMNAAKVLAVIGLGLTVPLLLGVARFPLFLIFAAVAVTMFFTMKKKVEAVYHAALLDLTPEQLERWKHLHGFARFIKEGKADQMDSVAESPDIPVTSPYLEYLPWAMAFGEAQQWQSKFGDKMFAEAQQLSSVSPYPTRSIRSVAAFSTTAKMASARPSQPSNSSGGGSRGGGGSRSGGRSGGGGGGARSR